MDISETGHKAPAEQSKQNAMQFSNGDGEIYIRFVSFFFFYPPRHHELDFGAAIPLRCVGNERRSAVGEENASEEPRPRGCARRELRTTGEASRLHRGGRRGYHQGAGLRSREAGTRGGPAEAEARKLEAEARNQGEDHRDRKAEEGDQGQRTWSGNSRRTKDAQERREEGKKGVQHS